MRILLFICFCLSKAATANENHIKGVWDHFYFQYGEWNFSRLIIKNDYSSELYFKNDLRKSTFSAEPKALKFENGLITITFEYDDEEAYPEPYNKLVLSLAYETGLANKDKPQLIGQSVWYFKAPDPMSIVVKHEFQKNGLKELQQVVRDITTEANKSN